MIVNPSRGRYQENLDALIEIGEELGALLGKACVDALGIAPAQAESYGKAAIVGEAGELEHARRSCTRSSARRCARRSRRRGAGALGQEGRRSGTRSTCRWATRTPAFVRSHFDAIEARVADAPRAGEILVAVAVTTAAGRCPGWGAWPSTRSWARTGCADAARFPGIPQPIEPRRLRWQHPAARPPSPARW